MAIRFRKAIEAIPEQQRIIGLQHFPHGACGDTSLLFGAYLVDHQVQGFMYVCGERGSNTNNTWTTHAWLQRDQLVIDLTADQFTDAPSSVIVSATSIWHSSFEVDKPLSSDFRL